MDGALTIRIRLVRPHNPQVASLLCGRLHELSRYSSLWIYTMVCNMVGDYFASVFDIVLSRFACVMIIKAILHHDSIRYQGVTANLVNSQEIW